MSRPRFKVIINLFNLRFSNLVYVIGFLAILLVFTSNLTLNQQTFSSAYPIFNRVSFDEEEKFSIMPIKNKHRDIGKSFFTTDPNNEKWKQKFCENKNQAGFNIGIQFICDPDDNIGQNDNNKLQNKNNKQMNKDITDKVNERSENFKERFEGDKGSIFGNKENDNFHSNNLQSHDKNHNKKGNHKDNNSNHGKDKNDDEVGIVGIDLGLNNDKKMEKVDKKIHNLKNKITTKNNMDLFQQKEIKDKHKNNKDKDNDDKTLKTSGLTPNFHNIQANLEKKIEKLKDKFENEKDNQRLIDQRNESDDDDDDDDSKDNKDSKDSKDDDHDDGNGKDYDGYGFKGDADNGNENGPENTEENFSFAAAGDFGCSANTQSTVKNIQSKDPKIVLALGDLSYHSTADCWFDMMSPIKSKLMITLGYHDVEDGQAKMNQYLNSFNLEKPFYSYDYNKVHFLIMSAKSSYNKNSDQYNFVVEDLKKAAENETVNWIVVSSYGPPYTSPSEHTAFKQLREVYHPIFDKYGVDLVLGGHNHNYQRTYPLTYNPNDSEAPTVISKSASEYDGKKDGIVFAIVGTGGVNLYPFDGQAQFVDKQLANKFGYLNIDISNGNPHTKLTGTFYDNKGGQILDRFTIDKELKSKNSEVVSS